MAEESYFNQYVVNPIQNAFTSLTKGEDLSGLPYEAQAAAIAKRQKLAELLMQQGQQQPEVLTYKGIAAQPSVAGGLGRALSQFMGAYIGGKADENLATATAAEKKAVNEERARIFGMNPAVAATTLSQGAYQGVDAEGIPSYDVNLPTPAKAASYVLGPEDQMNALYNLGGRGDMGARAAATGIPQVMRRLERGDKEADANTERQRILDQEKSLTQPPSVRQEDWNAAGTVPGMRTEMFRTSALANAKPVPLSDFAQQLVERGFLPGTALFNKEMDKYRNKQTYIAPVSPPAQGTPQTYMIDGKPVFTTPQAALSMAQRGSTVTTAAEAAPKKPAAKTVDQLKNEQLFSLVSKQLPTVVKNFGELGSKQNQIFAAIGDAKIPFTNIGIPKGSVTGTEYQLAETALNDIAAAHIYSVSGATASPLEVQKTVSSLMPVFGEGEAQKKAKLDRIRNMVEAIGVRAKGGFNEAAPLDADEQEYMRLKAIEEANG